MDSTENWDVYEQFRESMRRLAQDKIAPHAAEVDRTSTPPDTSYDALAAAGMISLPFPESAGGQEGDLMSQVIVVEESSRVCGTTGLAVLTTWAATEPIFRFGAPDLIEEVIPECATGKKKASWCMTEPRGGSDLAGLVTRAEPKGNGWVLNGTKRFISGATWSDWYLILARTGDNQHGLFVTHKGEPGLSFGKLETKMGVRGSPTADVILEDCFIPANRVVGDPTLGYHNIMASLGTSRPLVAAQGLGIAQGGLDEAIAYTREREQFGKPLSRFQMVQGMIADMTLKVESARAMLYRAIEMMDRNPAKARGFASMAKLICTDAAMSVTTDAVQLHGGYGYLQDYPVERMMRDAKVTQIYEGTNQIQRLLIAKHAYGD